MGQTQVHRGRVRSVHTHALYMLADRCSPHTCTQVLFHPSLLSESLAHFLAARLDKESIAQRFQSWKGLYNITWSIFPGSTSIIWSSQRRLRKVRRFATVTWLKLGLRQDWVPGHCPLCHFWKEGETCGTEVMCTPPKAKAGCLVCHVPVPGEGWGLV